MTQNDMASVLAEAFEIMEPRHAPNDMLTAVFSVTRTARQRTGLMGRLGATMDSFRATFQTMAVRPVVSFAVLIALLALLLVSAAFIGGALRERPATGWRALQPDPGSGEVTSVSAVVSTATGFVAAGSSVRPTTGACQDEQTRGRVWTSADGDQWAETAGDALVGARPEKLVVSGEKVYSFGQSNSCAEVPSAARVWRSTDGAAWELLPESQPFNLGNMPFIIDVGGTLVAAGIHQEPPPASSPGAWGQLESRVWISSDGADWEHVYTDPEFYFGYMAANEDTIVAIASRLDTPGAAVLRSNDLGRTWVHVETPGPNPDSLGSVAYSNGRFVALGANISLVSADGQTWTSTETPIGIREGGLQLWTQPAGFVASGIRSDGVPGMACSAIGVGPARPSVEALPTIEAGGATPDVSEAPETPEAPAPSGPSETCVPVEGSGGTWVSADGIEWTRGADLPQPTLEILGHYMLAAGHGGLVAADMSRNGMIWYAPLDDFRP